MSWLSKLLKFSYTLRWCGGPPKMPRPPTQGKDLTLPPEGPDWLKVDRPLEEDKRQ
jgi:hypothetical protein